MHYSVTAKYLSWFPAVALNESSERLQITFQTQTHCSIYFHCLQLLSQQNGETLMPCWVSAYTFAVKYANGG